MPIKQTIHVDEQPLTQSLACLQVGIGGRGGEGKDANLRSRPRLQVSHTQQAEDG